MIDFHCHLDLYDEPKQVAKRCEDEGIYLLSVTTTPSAWPGTRSLERGRIRTALGLHPQLAQERLSELETFDKYLNETRYVGEIGLDGAPEFKRIWDDQLKVFDHILGACAASGGRIMSIHSRRASRAVLDRLVTNPDAGTPVLHWFSGSHSDLKRAVDIGCWFSVGPAMLRSARGRELTARMPKERILTESDGPFAQVNRRSALPWDVSESIVNLAEIWNVDADVVRNSLLGNLRMLTTSQTPFVSRNGEANIG